jgi:glycine dehydrogenase
MSTTDTRTERAAPAERFADRHIGPRGDELTHMLEALGVRSIDELMDQTVPRAIRAQAPLDLPPARSEAEVMAELGALAADNRVMRSYLGLGYAATFTPPVIQRNVLENPGWYTQYTPYQAEIAQGRLEALLNFQTMVIDLTGLPVANASLLDEATAAAEAMTLCRRVAEAKAEDAVFFVSERCHPQTLAVLETRATPLGLRLAVGDHESWSFETPTFGALLQYPASDGEVFDYAAFTERAHRAGALVAVAADLLALTLLRAPGEFGADVCVGNSQRFGVPLGYGGPHAAFMACREAHRRQMPGRIVGVSRDAQGRAALRLALSTREQHIRRDKATSNICTAQVLLAVMASMYAVWHGPEGLTAIAARVRRHALRLARALREQDVVVRTREVFDTLRVSPGRRRQSEVMEAALARGINLRAFPDGDLGIALDETVTEEDLRDVLAAFGGDRLSADAPLPELPGALRRESAFLTHPVFHEHRSETEMLRYLRRLESRDLSLTTSMIPLGSVHHEAEQYRGDDVPSPTPASLSSIPSPPPSRRPATGSCSRAWSAGWPRSPASPPCPSCPTPAPRASTRACSRSAPTTRRGEKPSATSA